MFGKAYRNDMALEIFLRYLNGGIEKIDKVRESLFFIPDKVFARILKTASERKLISINMKNKTVFMSKKTRNVIKFIEKYNFIDELQKWQYDNSYKFSTEINSKLQEVRFFEKEKGINVNTELENLLKKEYGEYHTTEVLNFRFKTHWVKNDIYIDRQEKNVEEIEIGEE